MAPAGEAQHHTAERVGLAGVENGPEQVHGGRLSQLPQQRP